MREVEIRIRRLTREPDSTTGVNLMKQAFKEGGPLADPCAVNRAASIRP
jgi:hypothetical protein